MDNKKMIDALDSFNKSYMAILREWDNADLDNLDSIELASNTIKIGDKVIANDVSDYHKLVGIVVDIKTGKDKDTDNIGDDIYVNFELPDIDLLEEIEIRFLDLYGEIPEGLDFSLVIMDRSMLERILD